MPPVPAKRARPRQDPTASPLDGFQNIAPGSRMSPRARAAREAIRRAVENPTLAQRVADALKQWLVQRNGGPGIR